MRVLCCPRFFIRISYRTCARWTIFGGIVAALVCQVATFALSQQQTKPAFEFEPYSALTTPPCVAHKGLVILSATLIRAWKMVGFVLLHERQHTFGSWQFSGPIMSARNLSTLDFACRYDGHNDVPQTPLQFGSREFSKPGWREVAAWALCDVPEELLMSTAGDVLKIWITLNDIPIVHVDLDTMPPPRIRVALSAVMLEVPWHLNQWIRYHRSIGVDHARIYIASANVDQPAVRAIFQREGMSVDLVPWMFNARYYLAFLQNNAILDTSFWAVDSTMWYVVIDFDEFIQVMPPESSLISFLDGIDRWTIGSIRLHHFAVGPCPRVDRPTALLHEMYPLRSEQHFQLDRSKSIYRSKWTFLAMQHRIEIGFPEQFANPNTELRLLHFFCSIKDRPFERKVQWVPNTGFEIPS